MLICRSFTSTGGRARTDTVLSHHRILSQARYVQPVLVRPVIQLVYAVSGLLLASLGPPHTSLYRPGCSTVAVTSRLRSACSDAIVQARHRLRNSRNWMPGDS